MSGPDDATRPDPGAAARIAETHVAEAAADEDPLVGALIASYRIDEVLGQGGMGVVYRAFDLRLERPVALKTMRFESSQARARFHREARAQARLRHENVVPIHVVGDHAGLTYIVMDFVDGETLKTVLVRDGRFDEARALRTIDAIAAALEAAHDRGLIHRDVKPANVLVEPSGRLLLADFGLAKEIHAPEDEAGGAPRSAAPRSLTEPGSVLGTPAYLAPEQARGEKIDHRADMYALGITLHELLAGVRPDKDGTLTIPGDTTPETRTIVERLLAEDPANRYPTYVELRAAIAAKARGDREPAPALLATRAVAFTIDYVIVTTLGAILMIATVWGKRLVSGSYDHHELFQLVGRDLAVFLLAALEAERGGSLGKHLMRLRIEGRRSFVRVLGRAVVRMTPYFAFDIPNAPLEVELVLALAVVFVLGGPAFGKTHRAITDRVFGTRVVSVSTGRA